MLGHRKNKWTKGEEEALLTGIAKHGGVGRWSDIVDDPNFAAQLVDRTNINLKERYDVVATRLAEVEKKYFIAVKAVEEAERMQQLAEESQLMHQLCLDIHEQCALGKKVLLR